MEKIIGVVSGKGGVGKTTFVANVGLSLIELEKDVVVVDVEVVVVWENFVGVDVDNLFVFATRYLDGSSKNLNEDFLSI